MPSQVLDLMGLLSDTIDPTQTQSRMWEIRPAKWWMDNIMRLPIFSKLLFCGRVSSHYMLTSVVIRLTNLPVTSRRSRMPGMQFIEINYRLSLLTEHCLSSRDSYLQCRHFSQNSWYGDTSRNVSGALVSQFYQIRFNISYFRPSLEPSEDMSTLTNTTNSNPWK